MMGEPAYTTEHEDWARRTFEGAALGDARLNRRLIDVAARQANNPSGTIYANTGDAPAAREGAYRLLNNDGVTPEAIAAAGNEATATACAGRVVLSLEDTTTMSFLHKVRHDLGPIGSPKESKSRGWLIHSSLAVDANTGEVLGVLGQNWWLRDEETKANKTWLESAKWQELGDEVVPRALQSGAERVISVCDREADIFGLLMHKVAGNDGFVIRSMHDRGLVTADGDRMRLRERVEGLPILGKRVVSIGQRGNTDSRSGKRSGRKAQSMTLEVRATTLELQPPDTVPADERWPIEVGVVYVRQERAPKTGKPVDWLLLTSEPVATLQEACQVVAWYEKRWLVEEFHRAWKTGCRAEDALQQEADTLQRWLVILAFVGARSLHLRTLAEAHPEVPCTRVLPASHWKPLFVMLNPGKRIPRKVPTVRWALQSVGMLGGWAKSKNAPHPGYLTLARGWQKLDMFAAGWMAARAR